ncbi:hypothetical protein PtrV1_09552 [Pyrenophora tritici-repentis]|uniref:KRTAP multi-domain protein n=1 Tax=Pyrenophora tritici-repentis TaxID=45151 RepID=A0A2W1HUR2_9PLEO|nr:hypothetical protein PtrV1_09552 [Pyrenophora tritici-repentis]KAF7568541.1 KRTAP multi-domain protein [Pyrenophora tritici-repentis]KAI1539645.1 hypothetical protein PtrSN001C_005262 [Pyrenophora tritici-repentis]KAI1586465.1 hypothetical protein PtrEW7m1_001628 [Pyrenophora tritici-repentis]KAI1596711.1 hypothetical protein PtrEW13061_001670 [Pyrenophora tritici-repentis]
MCFDDDDEYSYESRTEIRNGRTYHTRDYYPRFGMSFRRRFGLGGSYYPSRYYTRPPASRYRSSAFAHPNRYSQRVGYPRGIVAGGYARGVVPGGYSQAMVPRGYVGAAPINAMEAYPKPRYQYIYNPRYGQRGLLTYAGQVPNGAAPAGVIGGYGYGMGYAGVGVGMGVGAGYAAGAYQPAVYNARSYYPQPYAAAAAATRCYYPSSYYSYPYSYGGGGGYGYYNYNLYGSLYPLANFYTPYQRTIYNTVPNYGYTAHVYPPGATTTTTTYHVTNSSAQPYRAPNHVVRETRPAYVHGHGAQGLTREDIQMENRRIATERGAYDPRKIRPADARDDDPFWCREVNGEWHLRSYYQIENECHPGRWMMDADMGFLVFHRA